MRKFSREDIERAIRRVVQPLAKGTFESVSGLKAKLTNVIPFGSADAYQTAFPFGMVSAPAKGVLGYFLNLHGKALAPIILSHIDKNRPTPSGPGESIFYCTDPSGESFPVKLTFGSDGTLKAEALTKVQVQCNQIEIGPNALESVVNGETYMTLYNAHAHIGNLGALTGVPLIPMTSLIHLSLRVKAAR